MNFETLIKKYEQFSELVEYWEDESKKEILIQNNKELKSYAPVTSSGFSVRMLVNGCFGFASSNDFSKQEKAFKAAYKLAKNASLIKNEKTLVKDFETHKASAKSRIRIDPFSIDESEKISYLKDFNNSFTLKGIKNVESTMALSKNKNFYANSKSSRITQESNYSQLATEANSGTENARNIRRAKKGYELFKFNYNDFIKETEETLKRLLNSKLAVPGKYNLILDPEITGTFFHEAVGHALEADGLREKTTCISMGEKLSSQELTLYDNPKLKDYWGSYEYDSEGIKSKKSILIKNGTVVNFMNDLSSYFDIEGLKKTSSGRKASIHQLPMPRMSNIEVKPGTYSKQELTEKLKNGLLVKGFGGGGVETSTGIFSFKANEAFIIKNGKIEKSLKGASLSGDLKQLMKNISGISKECGKPYNGGTCGKRESWVPVSEKVPYVLVGDVNVGN